MDSTLEQSRLAAQISFVQEIDKLKTILRQTSLIDGSRRENSAEHSWHLALMAIVLSEHSIEPVDLCKVLKILLIHDLVEIDAGDTFCYDAEGNRDKAEREERAADRIFGLLPDDVGADLRALWEEFEEGTSPEAKFATALDRLQPMMHNFVSRGGSWREHGIKRPQVEERNHVIQFGAPDLWTYARGLLDQAEREGFLKSE